MKNVNSPNLCFICIYIILLSLQSCTKDNDLQLETALLKERVTTLETAMEQMTASVLGLHYLQQGQQVVGVTPIEKGYKVELANGQSLSLLSAETVNGLVPLLRISPEGYWMYSTDQGIKYMAMVDGEGRPVKAYPTNSEGKPVRSPQMRISNDGYWQVSYDNAITFDYLMQNDSKINAYLGESSNSVFSSVIYDTVRQELILTLNADNGQLRFPVINTFYLRIKGAEAEQIFPLGETRVYEVEQSEVEEVVIQAPKGWKAILVEKELRLTSPDETVAEQKEQIQITIISPKRYIKVVTVQTKLLTTKFDANACKAWNEYITGSPENVLLDFSYAGYKHGEVAPPDVYTLGYKVFNVKDYGAVPNDALSDREAFYKTLEAAGATRVQMADGATRFLGNTNAIIYFPEGEYTLQGEGESNKMIHLTMGNFVIKGAGRDKTILRMDTENTSLTSNELWSPSVMLTIKHYSGLSDLTTITENAPKGSFTVKVASTLGIGVNDWVCLTLKNNTPELITKELVPHPVADLLPNNEMILSGVSVLDYHQVKSISGNSITFAEPLMHEVESKWGWKIQKYPHYENVGVEDLTLQGRAKAGFIHQGSASYTGGFKPLEMVRLTNSWIRRVNFVSVSEALTMNSCANLSAYDLRISGERGHSAIRSAASSRVFIGKVVDQSDGYLPLSPTTVDLSNYVIGAGQHHASGVSKQSIGTVLWRLKWGSDSNFEAHATQPRATLIDACEGSFIAGRQGGDQSQLPNHLDDLILWNMNVSKVGYASGWNNQFMWWDPSSTWLKCMPPVLIGFHGAAVDFSETFKQRSQYKRLESQGNPVIPYSLYEAQLRVRLGYVPAWLNSLK